MSKAKRTPEIIKMLGKLQNVSSLTDENLRTLHDYSLIPLVRCQYEMKHSE
ncbi:MAG TPA: hypothetical protein VG758_34095 [Hyphomicrobiaceae bacterium]|jgi:hypothetical protein|nr:hypothetical protein [Hyphomicrobiaceae bacterium]